MTYTSMAGAELLAELEKQQKEYEKIKAKGLKLDMSRGKPAKNQLDSVSGILTAVTTAEECQVEGIDVRNYGQPNGLTSLRDLWADVMGVDKENVFIFGPSSLSVMYGVISKAYTHGLLNSKTPWGKLDKVKFLCPSPGYDRHFKISESFGMEMITVPMLEDGPDMDMVLELIKDPEVKGMWCVPKYSNPTGVVFSDEVIDKLASMKPAAEDFVLMWDNAYIIHEFEGDFVPFKDILNECAKYGNDNMVIEFASTSKVTFCGGGVSFLMANKAQMEYIKKLVGYEAICFDKVNQLRHLKFLKDRENVLAIMKNHAKFLAPKFAVVKDTLQSELGGLEIAKWSNPKGGYFVSFDGLEGTAKRTLELCEAAGVKMTAAGSTFPYGIDPKDTNIRIAPSYPTVEELTDAMHIFTICVKIAALEKLIGSAE